MNLICYLKKDGLLRYTGKTFFAVLLEVPLQRISALILLMLLAACTSLTDQGDELFEKGLFLEAEKTYNAALQKDPGDAEAMAGLQRARVKILDTGLIEVRMLRLADNFLVAADKLEGLLQKQVEWKIRFTSGVAQTQEDETRKAKEFLIQEMNREVASGFAERAHWLGATHKTVLENSGPSFELDDVKLKITTQGKKRCTEFQSLPSAKDVFLRTFISRYCSLFGVAWSSKSKVEDPWLFSAVNFDNQYNVQKLNYSGNLNSQNLEGDFTKAFEASPYYNPLAGRTLRLKMAGTLSYVDNIASERRRKNYEIQEERVETLTTKDDKGNTKEEKTKKKRAVPKVFEYYVTTHDEAVNLVSTVSGSIGEQPLRSHFEAQAAQSSESHNESNAAAGISPVQAKLMDVNGWFAQQYKTASQTFAKDLDKNWGQHFCAMIPENSSEQTVKSGNWEMIERCGRVENAHQMVDTFYRTRFHLSYLEFWSLLKDGKPVQKGLSH